VYCPNCGKESENNDLYCRNCGRLLQKSPERESQTEKKTVPVSVIDHGQSNVGIKVEVPLTINKDNLHPLLAQLLNLWVAGCGGAAAIAGWVLCYLACSVIAQFGKDSIEILGSIDQMAFMLSLGGSLHVSGLGITGSSHVISPLLTLFSLAAIGAGAYTLCYQRHLPKDRDFITCIKTALLIVPWFTLAVLVLSLVIKKEDSSLIQGTMQVMPLTAMLGALIMGIIGACAGATCYHNFQAKMPLKSWRTLNDKRQFVVGLMIIVVAVELVAFAVLPIVGLAVVGAETDSIKETMDIVPLYSLWISGPVSAICGGYAHGAPITAGGNILGFGNDMSISIWSWGTLSEGSSAWHIVSLFLTSITIVALICAGSVLYQEIKQSSRECKNTCCFYFALTYALLWCFIGWLSSVSAEGGGMGGFSFGTSWVILLVTSFGLAFVVIRSVVAIYDSDDSNQANVLLAGISIVVLALPFLVGGAVNYSGKEKVRHKDEKKVSDNVTPGNQALDFGREIQSIVGSNKDEEPEPEIAIDDYQQEQDSVSSSHEQETPRPATERDVTALVTPAKPSDPVKEATVRSRQPQNTKDKTNQSIVVMQINVADRIPSSIYEDLPNELLCLVRNEYYARENCSFEAQHLRDYFSVYEWYHPESGPGPSKNFTLDRFSSVAQTNIQTILKVEKKRGSWHCGHDKGLPAVDDLLAWAHNSDASIYNRGNDLLPYQWSGEMKSERSSRTYQCMLIVNIADPKSKKVKGMLWQLNDRNELAAEVMTGEGTFNGKGRFTSMKLDGIEYQPAIKGWFLDRIDIHFDSDGAFFSGTYYDRNTNEKAGTISGSVLNND